jgi:hypothetical protein
MIHFNLAVNVDWQRERRGRCRFDVIAPAGHAIGMLRW